MTDRPTPREIEELATRLTPDQLLVLPFYHDLKNELTNPDQVRVQTRYFWEKWAPKLGPTMTVLVITLRSYCYFNKLTKEKRDWCYPEQGTLAAQVGVSISTIFRELRDNPWATHFIRREAKYRYEPLSRKKVRTTDLYHVSMDDPVAPEDEGKLVILAAERILKESSENNPVSPIGQFDRQVTRAVDNQPPIGQIDGYKARSNWQSSTLVPLRNTKNVNVVKKSPNADELERGGEQSSHQAAIETYLIEDILAVTGDPHSRAYYRKLVRQLSADDIRALISETRQAHLEGRIQTSPARFFTDLAQRTTGKKA